MERNSELIFGHGRFKCLGQAVALMELNKVFVEVRWLLGLFATGKRADCVAVTFVAVEKIRHCADRPHEAVEVGECGGPFAKRDVGTDHTKGRRDEVRFSRR